MNGIYNGNYYRHMILPAHPVLLRRVKDIAPRDLSLMHEICNGQQADFSET